MDNLEDKRKRELTNSVRVLHFNTYGGIGGAFIAADRLHHGFIRAGITSVLAYRHRFDHGNLNLPYPRYYQLGHTKGQKVENLVKAVCQHIGLNDVGNFLTYFLPRNPFFQQASILNLHNLHGDYFSYLALPRLTALKPTVWTLHDMWSFTGHCAYSNDCLKWQTGCGKCPHLNSDPPVKRDVTHLEWVLKQWTYQRSLLHIVTPSKWLAEQTRQSLLRDFPIHCIPYGIDTEIYQPLDQEQCRDVLGIPPRTYVLLFSAQSFADVRKGGALLLQALQRLPASLKAESILLTIGEMGYNLAQDIGIPHYHLGYINYERFKVMAYSAADLFLFPSRADNLPLVLQESMACGTPMVAFNVGGVSDLVRPEMTGYLAEPEDVQNFCHSIIALLEDEPLRRQMGQNCRAIALKEYPLELQVNRYLELYRQVLQSKK